MFQIGLTGARLRKRAMHWPLEQLYPRRAARIWRQGQAPTLVMLCGCGALGTPAALHWMGTCCGPCHDRGIDGTRIAASAIPGRGVYTKLAFSPDSRTLAVVNDGISLIDLETSDVTVVPLPDPSEWYMQGFVADGRLMLRRRTKTEHDIALWEPGDSALLHHNFSQIGRDGVVLSPGGNLMATSGGNGLRVFALPECRLLWAFQASPVHHVVFSHDNGWIAALGSIDHPGPQRVFEARSGRMVHELPEDRGRFRVAISSGGQFVVGVAPYPPMKLVLANLRDSPSSVSEVTPKWHLDCVRFDPSGRYLFARESNPLIWELPDLERPIELEWGHGELLDAAWSPDDRWLATGDNMGQLRLWPWRELQGLIEQTRVSESAPA